MLKGVLLFLVVAFATGNPMGQYSSYSTPEQAPAPAPQPSYPKYDYQQYQQAQPQPQPQPPMMSPRIPNPPPPAPEPVPLPLPFGPPLIPGPPPLPVPFVRPTLPLLPFYPVNPLPLPLPPLYPLTSDNLLLFDSGYARAQLPILPTRNAYLTPSFNIPPFHNPFFNPIISGGPPLLI